MLEFKFSTKGFQATSRQLKALARTLANIGTYSSELKNAVTDNILVTVTSGQGWAPKKDGSKATLIKTGASFKAATRRGAFKVIKKGNRIVFATKSNLGFHHYGTRTVPQRKVFKDNSRTRELLSRTMASRANKIIRRKLKGGSGK